jgi:hypothetical protein
MCWYATQVGNDLTTRLVAVVIEPYGIFHYPGPALLLVIALALWPLQTAIAAISSSVIEAYNPVTWFKSLRLFGTRYVAGAFAVYALLAAESYLMPHLVGLRSIPYAGAVLIELVAITAMTVRACVLGLVCEPYLGR